MYGILAKRSKRSATKYRGMEQLVARRAHNPKVVGSSPSPATKRKSTQTGAFLFGSESALKLPLLRYESDERGSLGFNFDRRRWRGEGEIETAAVERWRKSARGGAPDSFRAPQRAGTDNPKVVGSSPSPATK